MRGPSNHSNVPSLINEGICRSIVELGPALLLLSQSGIISDANVSAAEMFGYPLHELKSLTMNGIFNDHLSTALLVTVDGASKKIDCLCTRKNGERFWSEVSITNLGKFSNEILFSVHVIDLSLRAKTEPKKIKEVDEQALKVLESISDAFISLDKHFRFIYVNKKAATMSSRTTSLIGRNIWEEYPDLVDSEIYAAYHKALIEQHEWTGEYHYLPLDIWVKHHVYPSADGVSALIVDITEQKRQQRISVMEKEVLELYTNPEAPLEEILTLLLNSVQQVHPKMLCSILRAADGKLFTWASPHLPSEFNKAIDGTPIAYGFGACGTSAFTKEKVVVKDILSDSLTQNYIHLANKFQLKSCWSYPILDNKQNTLGTFAIYYHSHHVHKPGEEQTIIKACDILKNVLVNRHALEAVKKSEQVRRLIMDAALDAIICIDSAGIITLWNPKAESIFGWNEEEVLGRRMADLIIPAEQKQLHEAGMDHYIRTGHGPMLNKVFEVNALRRNGKEFPISLTILPVQQGDTEFFCAFIEDITEQKEANSQLQKAHTQLSAAQQIAKLGYWELDLVGNENYWSDQIFEICGIAKGENEPNLEKFINLIYPDDQEEFLKNYTAALHGSPLLHPEYRLVRTDGDIRYVHIEATRVCDKEGRPMRLAGTLQDITKIKENELALIKLNQELHNHTQALVKSNADLEQFGYIISHDLQEPLRMITSFLGQIEKRYNDVLDDKGKQYIFFAVDGAARMKQIIADLLEYSRVGKTDDSPQKIDVHTLLQEIVQLNSVTIEEKDAQIKWEQVPVINFYKAPLQTVLQNLVGNAIKYQKPDARPSVRIEVQDAGDTWQFAISDNGIGIDPKHFDKIFILFRRLHGKEAYSGTGLGLAICKKIIERYNGRIWVESALGAGSTFYFIIPKQLSNLNITGDTSS